MVYNILLGILFVSLVVSGVIVARKFPQLANLDIESLPNEREARKKREILTKRFEDRGRQMQLKVLHYFSPVIKLWRQVQLQFRLYVGKVERLWHHEERLKTTEQLETQGVAVSERVSALITQAEGQLIQKKYEQAEELFIAAIKLDSMAASAYRGLGDSYASRDALEEARETYRFVLRLESDDDTVMVKLADIAERQGDIEEAINYYQQAVVANDSLSPRFYHLAELLLKIKQPASAHEAVQSAVQLEPKNPKYLDLALETAILCGDKDSAAQAYFELRGVNPENQKLDEFRERINRM